MFLALGSRSDLRRGLARRLRHVQRREVIASGGTALAVAAEPALGRAGYWLMTITALFATAGATNAGLFPGDRPGDQLAARGSSRRPWPAASAAACRWASRSTAVLAAVLVAGFDLARSPPLAARSRCSSSRSSRSVTFAGCARDRGEIVGAVDRAARGRIRGGPRLAARAGTADADRGPRARAPLRRGHSSRPVPCGHVKESRPTSTPPP